LDLSRGWRVDKDDGIGLNTRMRRFVLDLIIDPGENRMRELVADLSPPRTLAAVAADRLAAATGGNPPVATGMPSSAVPANSVGCVSVGVSADASAAAEEFMGGLNENQRAAVRAVLDTADYSLILGMPGTGKTATLCAAVRALVARGDTVLIASHTHSAVDNVLERLISAGLDGVLRIGDSSRVSAAVGPFTLGGVRWPAASSAAVAAAAAAARVVGSTCFGTSDGFFAHARFTVAIVDEAGQIPLPAALGPLSRASRFVLVGDSFQLPPLFASAAAREAGAEESLFSRLAAAHPSAVSALCLQYRMAADIMSLTNAAVYSGRLKAASDEVAARCLSLPHNAPPGAPSWAVEAAKPDRRAVFLCTDGLGVRGQENRSPMRNDAEGRVAVQLARVLQAMGALDGAVSVLSPYNAQARARHSPPRRLENERSIRTFEHNRTESNVRLKDI
jgi:DNA replication ATP-dependent helicase Dna2